MTTKRFFAKTAIRVLILALVILGFYQKASAQGPWELPEGPIFNCGLGNMEIHHIAPTAPFWDMEWIVIFESKVPTIIFHSAIVDWISGIEQLDLEDVNKTLIPGNYRVIFHTNVPPSYGMPTPDIPGGYIWTEHLECESSTTIFPATLSHMLRCFLRLEICYN